MPPQQDFPYRLRPGQERLIGLVGSACESRAHLVVESGTGTGKTVCSLCGALEVCSRRGKKLLYLTRTNSQQRQVMHELRKIGDGRRYFGIALQGRRNMCPLAKADAELVDGNPEELSKVCGERKARVMRGDEGACKYFASTMSHDMQEVTRHLRKELPTAEEFVDYCRDRTLCPYEATKMHVPAADVVAAPYIMFFDGFIRHTLLDWMGCALSDIALVVDEAHNLPSYARELRSARLSEITLRLAEGEIDEFGDPEVAEGTSMRDLVGLLGNSLERAVEEYLIDEDGIIPQSFLEEELMFGTRSTSTRLKGVYSQLANYGEMVRDARKTADRLPRSYVHRTAGFLTAWHSLEEGEYVKLVVKSETSAFEAYCLDASIACKPVMECHSSVHMSGTLRPLDDYALSVGLPGDAVKAEVESPFPAENRRMVFVDDVTTRYEDLEREPAMVGRIASHITSILSTCRRNTIVFYPSYSTMERISDLVDSTVGGREVYREARAMEQGELMDVVQGFKSAGGNAVMHAVAGGRVSEGVDFPGEEMELAIIAGIPYPKPTARQRALQYFCEVRFGDGWEHAVKAPTTRKLLQAVGRLIRSETDRGIAVLLDRRAANFDEALGAIRCVDPAREVAGFFSESSPEKSVASSESAEIRLAR
jgi:DNA excision repair protein ERCC-2